MSVQPKTKAGRNEKCPCGSGLKFKWCHGDEVKQMLCNRVANEHMYNLILQEQKKRGLVPYQYTCNTCGRSFDVPNKGQLSDLLLCTNAKCNSTNLTINEIEKENGGENEEKNKSSETG